MMISVRMVGHGVMDVFRTAAMEETDEEQCGMLFGRRRRIAKRTLYMLHVAVPVKNVAEDPKNTFEIAGSDARKAIADMHRRSLHPVGIYHTHPPDMHYDPNPSPADRKGLRPKNIGAVIGVGPEVVTFYDDHDYSHSIDLFDD